MKNIQVDVLYLLLSLTNLAFQFSPGLLLEPSLWRLHLCISSIQQTLPYPFLLHDDVPCQYFLWPLPEYQGTDQAFSS